MSIKMIRNMTMAVTLLTCSTLALAACSLSFEIRGEGNVETAPTAKSQPAIGVDVNPPPVRAVEPVPPTVDENGNPALRGEENAGSADRSNDTPAAGGDAVSPGSFIESPRRLAIKPKAPRAPDAAKLATPRLVMRVPPIPGDKPFRGPEDSDVRKRTEATLQQIRNCRAQLDNAEEIYAGYRHRGEQLARDSQDMAKLLTSLKHVSLRVCREVDSDEALLALSGIGARVALLRGEHSLAESYYQQINTLVSSNIRLQAPPLLDLYLSMLTVCRIKRELDWFSAAEEAVAIGSSASALESMMEIRMRASCRPMQKLAAARVEMIREVTVGQAN